MNPTSCQRCGRPHVRCAAHRKDGEPCGQPPMRGQRICRKHGARAAQNLAAAERRRARTEAEKIVAEFGVPLDSDAHGLLQKLLNVSAGLVEFYRTECARLPLSELPSSTWLVLFKEERDHLARLCVRAIGAGLAEREIRLAEKHGALVAEVIHSVLYDIDLTPEQQARALTAVPARLREYGQAKVDE
jgi:hypothetical protein